MGVKIQAKNAVCNLVSTHIYFCVSSLATFHQYQVIYFATRVSRANGPVSNYQNSQFGFEAEGNKTKEMNYLSRNFNAFSFVFTPQPPC